MFKRKKIQVLDDFFKTISDRGDKITYFYRINGYSIKMDEFIRRFYDEAVLNGIVIEGRIPNPTEKNIEYYYEIMGTGFAVNAEFIDSALMKWLPRISPGTRKELAALIYSKLDDIVSKNGNENIAKNAYVKIMCWLYYKMERVIRGLGKNIVPKILYEGSVSKYELMMLDILANAGCDIVLLQYQGDKNYLTLDGDSKLSYELIMLDMTAFPEGYTLKNMARPISRAAVSEKDISENMTARCTNAWLTGNIFEDILKPVPERGQDSRFFYNVFCRIVGAEDRLTYLNELYTLTQQIKNSKRNLLVLENSIPIPTPEEIKNVKRRNYSTAEDMICGLSENIRCSASTELQSWMIKAFSDTLREEQDTNLNRLLNKAVYMLCRLNRYKDKLFDGWHKNNVPCLIYFGGCRDKSESLFIRMMAKMPIDVLILVPDLNMNCCLEDKMLYEIRNSQSVSADRFPSGNMTGIGTTAYYAEQELDDIIYTDTGLYRNKQHDKADAVTLKTMYEEIEILWKQELKYRPSFGTEGNKVNMPVIFAKVSGVKNKDVDRYWRSIKRLITPDTVVISKVPYIKREDANPFKGCAAALYRNKRLMREDIKKHPSYKYGILRESMQEHILDKLQQLINSELIKGTFKNGTEYTIVSTALNMSGDILRKIQSFDFTKKNPKLLYINTTESVISTEDAILTLLLHMIGFDVVFFIPTGYRNIENCFNKTIFEEHQTGDYVYDLNVPDFSDISENTRFSLKEIIFGRGR